MIFSYLTKLFGLEPPATPPAPVITRSYPQIIVDIALSQVGTKEVGGNNKGAKVHEYQRATWLNPAPWPWCAAFCCWVLKESGYDPKNRCMDASAYGWEQWARAHGHRIIPETELANAGDFVIFDFSHIGVVVKDQRTLRSPIVTVEGNTNGKGERDSVSGDGVWQKSRAPSLTKCFIRLK